MRKDDEKFLTSFDTELLHSKSQGAGLEAQALGSVALTGDFPTGLVEYRKYVLAFLVFKGLCGRRGGLLLSAGDVDTEFLHAVSERARIEAEPVGGVARTADPVVAIGEHTDDMGSFQVF